MQGGGSQAAEANAEGTRVGPKREVETSIVRGDHEKGHLNSLSKLLYMSSKFPKGIRKEIVEGKDKLSVTFSP